MSPQSGNSAHVRRRYAVIVALFSGVLYFALIVAVLGILALLTGTDMVPNPDFSDLLGPAMILSATLTLTLMLAARKPRDQDEGLDWGWAILSGFAAAAAFILVGFLGAISELGVLQAVSFAWITLFGGYDLIIGSLAFVVALVYSFVLARRYDDRGRPRWSWEDDFDE